MSSIHMFFMFSSSFIHNKSNTCIRNALYSKDLMYPEENAVKISDF